MNSVDLLISQADLLTVRSYARKTSDKVVY